MLPHQQPLSTERLVIRAFEADDFPAYYAYHRLPQVYRYLYCRPPDAAAARAQLDAHRRYRLEQDGDALHWAVALRDGGALVGEVLLKQASAAARQGELGYIFDPAHGGRGYAREAAAAALGLAFDELGWHRVFARLDPLNAGSVALAERLGMRREAHFIQNDCFDGRWGDEYVYAMLASEHRGRGLPAAPAPAT